MSDEFLDHGNSTDEESTEFPIEVIKETNSCDDFYSAKETSLANIVSKNHLIFLGSYRSE